MKLLIGYRPWGGYLLSVRTYWYPDGRKRTAWCRWNCRYLTISWRGGAGYHYRDRFKKSGRSIYIRTTLRAKRRAGDRLWVRWLGPTGNANLIWRHIPR